MPGEKREVIYQIDYCQSAVQSFALYGSAGKGFGAGTVAVGIFPEILVHCSCGVDCRTVAYLFDGKILLNPLPEVGD